MGKAEDFERETAVLASQIVEGEDGRLRVPLPESLKRRVLDDWEVNKLIFAHMNYFFLILIRLFVYSNVSMCVSGVNCSSSHGHLR